MDKKNIQQEMFSNFSEEYVCRGQNKNRQSKLEKKRTKVPYHPCHLDPNGSYLSDFLSNFLLWKKIG